MPMPAGWTVNHKDAERAGTSPNRPESVQDVGNGYFRCQSCNGSGCRVHDTLHRAPYYQDFGRECLACLECDGRGVLRCGYGDKVR